MDLASWITASPTHLLGAAVTVLLLGVAYLIVVRLILSPIAGFPGPKLAGLTFWYEFYYDVVLGGRYTWKIKELHEKYGEFLAAEGVQSQHAEC